ncbi:MAG: hypothetical protein IBX61_07720 [Thermoleophilia bacterium]|nr:hypothetical protein [Thermoleophilia bacterium]
MYRRAALGPVLVLGAHFLFIITIYGRFPWVSDLMHLAGGFAMALFFLSAFTGRESDRIFGKMSGLTVALMAISLTTMVAVFWEFAEWTADNVFGTHTQLGLNDTMSDLLLGLTGAVAVSLLHAFLARNRRKSGPSQACPGRTKDHRVRSSR